jgi:hypothetical protein
LCGDPRNINPNLSLANTTKVQLVLGKYKTANKHKHKGGYLNINTVSNFLRFIINIVSNYLRFIINIVSNYLIFNVNRYSFKLFEIQLAPFRTNF